MNSSSPRISRPLLFICDIQEGFRNAIYAFPYVIATASKMLRAATVLKIPVLMTTQKREKLGDTCTELKLANTGLLIADVDKSRFSMWLPEVQITVEEYGECVDVIIVGIETHICVLQTTLDLIAAGHRVWVCVDGVSSCNEGERRVALERMQREGARLTSSESVIYELMEDASAEGFKDISRLVKETKKATAEGVSALCKM